MQSKDVYLTARAGGGKDTQGNLLIERYGYERISLADPVKDITCLLLGIPRQALEAGKKTYRPMLIAIGQGARLRRNWWVRCPLIPIKLRRQWLTEYLMKQTDYRLVPYIPADSWDFVTKGWGRPDVWLKRFERKYLVSRFFNRPVVVTDCRMPNEAKFLRKLGFNGARIYVSVDEAKKRLFERDGTTDFSFFNNETERHADKLPVDWVIDGGQTAEEVHSQLVAYLQGR